MRRRPVAWCGSASRGLSLAVLILLAAAPSCGGGSSGDQTAKFVGPWTFSSGTLMPMCPISVPNFNLTGLPVTFQKVDNSTISLTLNAGCVVDFKVSGSKATVAANQTCTLDAGAPLNMVSIAITKWSLSLVGDHIDNTISGSASLCTAMGTATLVRGTIDAGVTGGGGHGGSGTTGGAGVGGSAGVGGGAGSSGAAGTDGSAGAGGSTGAAGSDGGLPDGPNDPLITGETGTSDASDAPATETGADATDAPVAMATYTTTSGDHVHVAGDSETLGAIVGPAGTSVPWQHYLNAQIGAGAFTEVGATGTTWAYFSTNFSPNIGAFGPTLAFLEWGINDIGATAPATAALSFEQGVMGLWSTAPKMRIVVLGIWGIGEKWPDGAAGVQDVNIDAMNAAIKASCDKLSSFGTITYVETRPAWMAALQTANPTNGSGYYLTVDHLHLNDAGAHVISNIVAAAKST